MKKSILTALAVGGLLAVAVSSASAQAFVGLGAAGNFLNYYSAPGAAPNLFSITGLSTGDSIVGIDFFTSTAGPLYGIGTSGNLYQLNQSGAATYSATINVAAGVPGANTIDFNPMANRLRVYAGTSNYRLTPGTGTLTSDGTLTYANGDANFGATPNLRAAAYTNNVPSPASTQLYSIDTTLNALILNTVGPQFSTLTTVGGLTLNGAVFDVPNATTGLDILTVSGVNTAYLSSGNNLYTVNLANGNLTLVGAQGGGAISDIAFVPEPGTYALLGAGALVLGAVAFRRRQQAAV